MLSLLKPPVPFASDAVANFICQRAAERELCFRKCPDICGVAANFSWSIFGLGDKKLQQENEMSRLQDHE